MRVGIEWEDLGAGADHETTTQHIQAGIYVWTQYNCTDSSNTLAWGGSAGSGSGAVSIATPSGSSWSPSNIQKIHTIGAWVGISYGAATYVQVDADLSGIDWVGTGYHAVHSLGGYIVARPYGLPAAPTGCTVARVSDTQQNVSWTNVNNSPDSGHPYTNLVVQRWDNVTNAWATVQTLGVVASWSDTTTVADRQYQYRVYATNSAGSSGVSTSSTIYTTPAAPTNAVAAKAVSDIQLTWEDNSTTETAFEIYHKEGAGAYHLEYTTAAGATSWTHVAPNAAATHTYQVRSKADTLTSDWATSNTVQLLTAPNAPTNLGCPAAWDATTAMDVTWQHNPVDSTTQTAYQFRWREVGGPTWTTGSKTASTTQGLTIAGGTFTNNHVYEWQVCTWGQHADASPWSASKTFQASAIPTATISTPAVSAVVDRPSLTAEWAYYDAEGTTQAAYEVVLYASNGTTILKQHQVATAGVSQLVDYVLADGGSYQLGVRVRDGHGLWSAEDKHAFTVAYAAPMKPTVVVTFDADTGGCLITVTNPGPEAGEPDVVYNDVYRAIAGGAAIQVASNVGPNGSVTDYVPAIGALNSYTVVAYSALPSANTSDPAEVTPNDPSKWLWFNAGPNFSLMGRVRGNPVTDRKASREQVLHRFAGRRDPVVFTGDGRAKTIGVRGAIDNGLDEATRDAFDAIVDAGAPVCYRDSRGHRMFGALDAVTIGRTTGPFASFSTTITEVDGDY